MEKNQAIEINAIKKRFMRVLCLSLVSLAISSLLLNLLGVLSLTTESERGIIFFIIVLISILIINKEKYLPLSSLLMLILMTLIIAFIAGSYIRINFNDTSINHLITILYFLTLPTATSGFLIKPLSSMIFAIVSTAILLTFYGYISIWQITSDNTLSTLKIAIARASLTLIFLGVVSWYFSKRLNDFIIQLHAQVLQLGQMHREKKLSDEKLALHVRLTPLGVIEWDKNFRVKEWNAAAEKIFGYSKEEALDKHPTDIILPEAVRDIVNQIWEALLNQKGGTRSTNDNLTKQGNTIVCDWYNTPLINDEGQVFGVTSVVQDVTESIKMNKDLKEAKILADKANQAKSEFLANMSHEIRTPMNAILGFTEILNARLKDPVEKDYLDSIASSGKTLLRLINDILDLSKVEAGRIELEYSEVDIKSILHDIKQIFSQSAKAKSLKLEVFPGADMPELISLDEIRLRQILLNLVGNAIKFTQSGSVIISANAFKTDKSDKSFDIEITVTDTGIGISADKIDTIFDSFVQIKDQNRHFEGTGLGLTISNKLIKLMGGSISVQSVLNQGTSFIIKIPDVLWVDPAFSDTPLLPDIQSNMLFSPASILVVDDIENNRKVLKGFLEDYPFTILEAINGQSAVETAKLEIPDLIIMDLKMPVLDGYEATLIIKEHPETKHIPIVVASASSMRSQKEKIEPYIDGFVRKPFNKTDILLNISKLLPFSPKPASQSQNIPNPPDLSENINNISKQDYIELNNNLDGSLIEKWSEISQTLEFKEIGKFAHSVNEVAKDLGYIPVVKWSEKLISATKLFHVDIIKSLMSDFSLLLNHVHGRDIDISKNVKSEELK